MNNAQAFTLIELLVVVLIIGILAAVALPQYQVVVEKARVSRVLPVLQTLVNAQDTYYLANGTYSKILENLDVTVKYDSIDEAATSDTLTVYKGVNGGKLNLYSGTKGVVWFDGHIVINFYYSPNQIACYHHDNIGQKVCRAFSNGKRGDGNLLLISF